MTDESRGSRNGSGPRNSGGGPRSGGPSGGRGAGNGGRPRSGGGRSGGFRGGRDGGRDGGSDRRDDRGGARGGGAGRPRGEGGGRRDEGRGDREFRGGGRGDRSGDRRSGGGRPDRDRRDGSGRPQRRGPGGGQGGTRSGSQQREPREGAPQLPDEVTFSELTPEVRRELNSLPKSLAEIVGRHLAAAARLLEEAPERAYEHAAFARRRASRLGVVREAAGISAYTVGKWQEALSDLRAARRMTGRDNFLAMIADCERGLGRPERALEIAREPEAENLPVEDRVELRIVAAGARHDLGQHEAAVVELQIPELKERRARPWVARLFYAYADAVLACGRRKDAREYFARASAVDREGLTDADERLAELEGVEIVDIGEDVVWTDAEDPYAADEEFEEGESEEPRPPRRPDRPTASRSEPSFEPGPAPAAAEAPASPAGPEEPGAAEDGDAEAPHEAPGSGSEH
ncbi:tetratricopeptide repeat protein [Streptomonospora wellingtoniae]|uniref:Tetratricopeptide repeat protein n=1 Tax=Streptomonospora wellingtoniae TaxID=3075544 RepID=A0ABU2KV22_9ACTN|nr:hypothetical protein [Streptomonospora sp. DSM 45055]MDT0303145.1 hypothetical protein [Streptomonospora sp. DSM 45055]